MVERDHVGGVDERQAQILGHQASRKVLAAAYQLLGGVAALAGALGKRGKLLADGIGKPKFVRDIEIALTDVCQKVIAGHVVIHVGVDQIQKVGDLGVTREPTTARGHNHKATGGICVDDPLDLLEVLGIGDRRAAELGDLNHVNAKSFPVPSRQRPPDRDISQGVTLA